METFSALLTLYAGNSPVPGEFPTQRPVTRSFDVYFDLRPNRRLSKQSWGWWFETASCSLWRHRNAASLSSFHSLHWSFPSQLARVSMSWRHHGVLALYQRNVVWSLYRSKYVWIRIEINLHVIGDIKSTSFCFMCWELLNLMFMRTVNCIFIPVYLHFNWPSGW